MSNFCPGHSRFPVGGAFCPQLDSLTPGQPPIGVSQDLNFKEQQGGVAGGRGGGAVEKGIPDPASLGTQNNLRLGEAAGYFSL